MASVASLIFFILGLGFAAGLVGALARPLGLFLGLSFLAVALLSLGIGGGVAGVAGAAGLPAAMAAVPAAVFGTLALAAGVAVVARAGAGATPTARLRPFAVGAISW